MKRRNFLKNIGAVSSAPIVLNGIGLSPFASPEMLDLFTTCTGIKERAMVVVFLKGGNDGLNTIVPTDQYDLYKNHRPNIALKASGAGGMIELDSTLAVEDHVSLNPSMTSFKSMYEDGKARLIQAVGYPSFNQSHFKSSDLWLSGKDGSNAGASARSGLMGRFIEHAYPGANGSPSGEFPDPLGVQFGDRKASLLLHDCASIFQGINLSNQRLDNLSGLLNGLGSAPHASTASSDFGREIDYIMQVENSTSVYGNRITNVYNSGTNVGAYPDNKLGDQLQTIAKLLSGGSQTKVFQTHTGGFDTHAGQVEVGSTGTGRHANLLSGVFNSIKAFHDDLEQLGLGQKVVTLVFSEFSRRIKENGSSGTDHGNYGPMFLFGEGINPGITGTNFDLTAVSDKGKMQASELQTDYRSVFKTVLQDWMGAGGNILDPAELGSFAVLPGLIKQNMTVDPSCYIGSSVVPVEVNYFSAELTRDKMVDLEWETEAEINVDRFEIIRKSEGHISSILEVKATGSETDGDFYEAVDRSPVEGVSYYRLKSIDLDGSLSYSDWQSVEVKDSGLEDLKVYPNPATYDFNVAVTLERQVALKIDLATIDGRILSSTSVSGQEGFNKVNIDVSSLPKGHYIVDISGKNISEKRKIVILDR